MTEDLQGYEDTQKASDKMARKSTKAGKIALAEGGKTVAKA